MLSRGSCKLWPLALALTLLTPTLLAGQNPPEAATAEQDPAHQVAAELIRLNNTLERLELLLQRQLEGKKVELTMKRVDSLSRRLEGLEGQVRNAQDRRRSLEETLRTLQQEHEQVQTQLGRQGMEEQSEQFQAFFAVMDQRHKDYQQRIAQADREIAELEAQRDTLGKEVVDWQDYIDRQIGDL